MYYMYVLYVFFFKQKTAYEMRISDWSSDVCSSDLRVGIDAGLLKLAHNPIGTMLGAGKYQRVRNLAGRRILAAKDHFEQRLLFVLVDQDDQIGRASCRERVCQYV